MRKIQVLLIFILSVLIVFTENVHAVDINQVTITSDKTEVKPMETFVITVSANSNSTIDGLSSEMKFNENILEIVSSQLVDNTNWADLDTFPKLIAIWKTQTSDVSKADIYKITFRVKSGIVQQDTNIRLSNIILSTALDGQNPIKDAETIIHIKSTGNEEDNNGGNGDNTGDNNGGNGDNTGDNNGGNGDNTGDNNGGNGDNTGDNNGGNGDNTGDNNGGNGDNTEDNNGGNGDITGENNGGNGDKGNTYDKNDLNNLYNKSDKSTVTGNGSKYTDLTASGKGLPFTGGILGKIILVSIAVFTILGVYQYILYRKYKNV